MTNLYRMTLRKNFVVHGDDKMQALGNARRELVSLLNDGWFYDADFEIIEQVYPEPEQSHYDNVQEGELSE